MGTVAEYYMEKRKTIEEIVITEIYQKIGIDRPSNHDEIIDFILEDIEETADPITWHSGDVAIAFRRYLEKS